MKGRVLAGLFLCSLFFVVGGDAQSPNTPEKPVWTLEFIKVRPENVALAMQYLNDHWMRVRAAAKRRGAVLGYHLISNAAVATPGHKVSGEDSIVLITKYKNMGAYLENMSAPGHPATNKFIIQGFGSFQSAEDLFETLNTQVFIEEPDTSTGFKLLTKR